LHTGLADAAAVDEARARSGAAADALDGVAPAVAPRTLEVIEDAASQVAAADLTVQRADEVLASEAPGSPRAAAVESARDAALAQKRDAERCVEINHWFGGSPPNFRTLYLGQIDVDSADFWTDRLLSSASRSTAKESGPNRSITRTLKSG